MIKVGINGYGTIGKRVAEAVTHQDDMEIVGIVKTKPTYEIRGALDAGFPVFASTKAKIPFFEEKDVKVSGVTEELVDISDVIIDCTPGKLGVNNMAMYQKYNTKAIWQGGEKHAPIGVSFNALTNYSSAINQDYVRVVSCNTTGLARTLYPLLNKCGIDNVQAVMVRRSGDPKDSDRGPINSIEPVLTVPSHHGPDVQTVIEGINIQTMAVKVPTTIMHVHCIIAELDSEPNVEEILSIWDSTPRVNLLEGFLNSDGNKIRNLPGTAEIMEFARDALYTRGDLNQIAVWKDGVHSFGKKLYYYQAIHQESDVIPENIDAIRAMFNLESDNIKSIVKTNKALGID
ncbi:MAG: type II glyceraldehyde-3-phosphate dehydrogenase [Methanobacteriota archaeon]|nr:MAG: type II glyceraldehyde-3-phosphate dehydrogenase [Euryarchaeota archaeon]